MELTFRFYELAPMTLLQETITTSWKDLYNTLSNIGIVKTYEENNVSENEFETFIRNLDTRLYRHDEQKETSSIVIKEGSESIVVHIEENI